jgi:DUF438 domain-containing protein
MSEQIDNSKFRKEKLKALILKLHSGESQDQIRAELEETLGGIPYGEVVEVEQELISEGLPEAEVLKLCDAHSAVLEGNVDLSASKTIPAGHPIDVLIQENNALKDVTGAAGNLLAKLGASDEKDLKGMILELTGLFNQLMDVDKHYQRKEYLMFPYLEKAGVTGPPKVMWGKHDEIRELLKGSLEILRMTDISKAELISSAEIVIQPALKGIAEMIVKEESILFPMLMDKLSNTEWAEVQKQSLEIGYCLVDPQTDWQPPDIKPEQLMQIQESSPGIKLPSGQLAQEELLAILNTLPVDITFVDRNDRVKYFSQSRDRIFPRTLAILNRDVRHCHPPASTHIVDKIIGDFKSGRQSRAPFWINLKGRFIHIEYFALRGEKGEYLGTLEVSQDLSHYRELEGEQRILSYK